LILLSHLLLHYICSNNAEKSYLLSQVFGAFELKKPFGKGKSHENLKKKLHQGGSHQRRRGDSLESWIRASRCNAVGSNPQMGP
jgi:hypothetical protein